MMSKDNLSSKDGRNEVDKPCISVVVPFYNSDKHLESCISALLSQTYPSSSYEIIMVDNNSTDNSTDVVRKYPQIILLSEAKKGSYAARNRGVAESKGSVIAFTDSDCIPVPEWLDRISASLSSPGVGIVQGGRLYSTRSASMLLLEAYESERAMYTFSGKSTGLYYGYTNNMAVRRRVFDRCGPFLEVMRGADSIFVNRAIEDYSPEIIRYAPDASIRHLEITGVPDYLCKRFIYGRSLQQNYSRRKRAHRNMTVFERFDIIRRTVKRNRYSKLQFLSLIMLVSIGMISFRLGRLSVQLESIWKGPPGSLWSRNER
jgi:glycosyltransferase involved in cell wall biosynthesis